MSFLADATQDTIDREIAIAKVEYDIHAYETSMLDQKRRLTEVRKSELIVKARMAELQAMIAEKKKELNSL